MNTEYIMQVYMRGAGWLDFGVYYDKTEAETAAQIERQKKYGPEHVRVINGDAEDEAAFEAQAHLI